jgi:hypothetical protein
VWVINVHDEKQAHTSGIQCDTATAFICLFRYCYRKAELGIGDCGGLRLIPGMKKNSRILTLQLHSCCVSCLSRYCYRQAELGIGHHKGLRLIPGLLLQAGFTIELLAVPSCNMPLSKLIMLCFVHRYCYRQAELGIGDCGGLRLIPGMTKSGKQETPEWLQKVLGVEVPKVENQGKTLADLLGPKPGN